MARTSVGQSNREENKGSGAYWKAAADERRMLALTCKLDGHRIGFLFVEDLAPVIVIAKANAHERTDDLRNGQGAG